MKKSKRINDMRQFYYKLYSTECNASNELRKAFLDQTNLPSFTEEQQEHLNRPITREEVLGSIRTLENRKAPGWDGYRPELAGGLLSDLF